MSDDFSCNHVEPVWPLKEIHACCSGVALVLPTLHSHIDVCYSQTFKAYRKDQVLLGAGKKLNLVHKATGMICSSSDGRCKVGCKEDLAGAQDIGQICVLSRSGLCKVGVQASSIMNTRQVAE